MVSGNEGWMDNRYESESRCHHAPKYSTSLKIANSNFD